MCKPVVLITGASGEMGHGLINALSKKDDRDIVALDLHALDDSLASKCLDTVVGDITDTALLARLSARFEIHAIFHLAALLSTRAEYTPMAAHRVNVDGTMRLLELASAQSSQHGNEVRFLFPSSIAVFGLPDLATKESHRPLREFEWNKPTTMYGCNKLYCEQLGRYYTIHYRQLDSARVPSGVDFRAIRFPGLISALTVPSGGTSDYAPEMLHAAASGKPCACFVAPGARIPFMAMTDAIRALIMLESADATRLTQRVYNINAFSLSAAELRDIILRAFPDSDITFAPDSARASIVDTWPAYVDDSKARHDWDWAPVYDRDAAFEQHLIPAISARYAS